MFYVMNEKAIGGKGYTVRDYRANVQYRCSRKAEAEATCERFNRADGMSFAGHLKFQAQD